MKDGDRLLKLVDRRNKLKTLWMLFSSPELMIRDYFDWMVFDRANRN